LGVPYGLLRLLLRLLLKLPPVSDMRTLFVSLRGSIPPSPGADPEM
jgi:hypothetical protein